ncbi:MAG: SpoIIE family protein phosphatase [Oscillospiraceae bacterium]|nr:SpoIIE family protein phosphatase [Oscillospiraceae bacterium]
MKTSIQKKIASAFVVVSVLALVASGVLSMLQLREIRDIAEEALIDLSRTDLKDLATEKGSSINSRLQLYADKLSIMAIYSADLYVNPDDYLKKPVPFYLDMPPGEPGLHYFPEPWAEPSLLEEETMLLANSAKIFAVVMERFPEITTICISTDTGQNLQFDSAAAQKQDVIEQGFSSHTREWYIRAKEKKEMPTVIISDTYRDAAGRGLTITMSKAIMANGEFKGVLAFDILIDDLDKRLRSEVVGTGGRIELIGVDKVISSQGLTTENEHELPEYWEAVSTSVTGTAISGDYYIAWSRIGLTGWKVVLLVPESEITAPVERADKEIYESLLEIGMLLIAIVLLTVYVAFLSARRIAAPLLALAKDAEKIGKGDDIELSAKTGDEIEVLAGTINEMLINIKTITGEKERIGAELNVATNIQASMLPHIFPPFPERTDVDLFGTMEPAKEVGGDFYDFFLIDDNTLAVIMADVSGKGVPAALFMVIGKTLIKNNAQMGKSPKEVFETVNNILCENNDADLFITCFMGYLDLKTGEFTSVNAGHNPPLIGTNGKFNYYKTKIGFVLAGMEGTRYTQETVKLKPGDSLFLYTDGVTEADNHAKELYGEKRLNDILNSCTSEEVKETCLYVRHDVEKFVAGAEQADDISMLVLKYLGQEGTQS